tara:strand:- start:914 stop:1057 length:144 start_codon:yes stop_codon:yes gene_type:complete
MEKLRRKVLAKVKKKLTNKKNVSPASRYVRAVDARNAAIKKAFGDNF